MANRSPVIGIEKRWRAQYNNRFKAMKGRVNRLFAEANEANSPEFVQMFQVWFSNNINQLLLEGGVANASIVWQNEFIKQAYIRGVTASNAALARSKIVLPAVQLSPLKLIEQKSFSDLKGIVGETEAQVYRALITGIENSESKSKLAKAINDRVDKIGRTRSHVLVNTRTTETYNAAEIAQAEAAAKASGADIEMEWFTEGDSRVRTTHALRNRKLYSPTAAQRLIGEPGCRCHVKLKVGKGTAKEQEERTAIRKRQLKISKQAIEERRFFESIGPRPINPTT
jgi:hypothetical protein